MRVKIITVICVLAIMVGLIALIQWKASTSSPVQGSTADPVRGDDTAKVSIQEYSDFQCPACKALEPNLKKVLQEYPGQVKLSYNDFPLRQVHPSGALAAEAGQCAYAQNRFWDYHDLLFQRQSEWPIADNVETTLADYAAELGLDRDKFQQCLNDDSTLASISEDETEGNNAKITSTPTVFVNGTRLVGPTYDQLHAEVAKQLGQ
ncbi:MAG: DsbA family protein [Patescibacteria group bacterium]